MAGAAGKMARAAGRAHSMRSGEAMTTPTPPAQTLDTATIAELNDLLQLDHDALNGYDLTMRELKSSAYRETVRRYRRDHERHVEELTALVRAHGGQPVEAAHPSSVDKLGLQALGDVGGGDTHVLVAFRNNERQSRDKYARAAEKAAAWPADVQTVVRSAASDERRHYDWVDMTVQSLGVTDDSAVGVAARGVEVFHARTHDAAEAVEKQGLRGYEAARRALTGSKLGRRVAERPLESALVALGAGVVAAGVIAGARRAGRKGGDA